MDRGIVRKAAWITAAGTLSATAITGVSQTAADASVTMSCGRNFTPSKAIAATIRTVETKGAVSELGWGRYPQMQLRSGTIDGFSGVIWARVSTPVEGLLDLDWGPAANNTTHRDCRFLMSYVVARNYTQGVIYGWNNPPGESALYFRPCELKSQSGVDGPWDCAGWIA